MPKSVKIKGEKLAALIDGNPLLTVADVARSSGINRESISNYKSPGVNGVSPQKFMALAKGLGKSPEELLAIVGITATTGIKVELPDQLYDKLDQAADFDGTDVPGMIQKLYDFWREHVPAEMESESRRAFRQLGEKLRGKKAARPSTRGKEG